MSKEGNDSWSSKNKKMLEEKEENERISGIVTTVGVFAAGMAFAAWGISKLIDETTEENNKKMMKKPGADGYMIRDDFEKNPKTYFRDLHGKK